MQNRSSQTGLDTQDDNENKSQPQTTLKGSGL